MRIGIEISPGELLDKVSILEIKNERIQDEDKLGHVRREMETLNRSRSEFVSESDAIAALYAELKTINEQLWVIEDDIRLLEKASDFGEAFIALARSVYITNDRRAGVKRAIDELLNSAGGAGKSSA